MANKLLTGQILTQALCVQLGVAFEERNIETIPHDRWNCELRGDEKDLNLVWYDMPHMSNQDLCLSIDRFEERFLRPAAVEIAAMVARPEPIEMLTLPFVDFGLDFQERCTDHERGIACHLYRAYSVLTNTMPWWTRLAYRVHTVEAGPPVEFCHDAAQILGIIGYSERLSPHDLEIIRTRWRPGMTVRQLAGAIAPIYDKKSPLSLHEQYVAGRMSKSVDFQWFVP